MRLKHVVDYLRKLGLDQPLLDWFRTSAASVEGKVLGLHFVLELQTECWNDPDFGNELAVEFAKYLQCQPAGYDPVPATKSFYHQARRLRFRGKRPIREDVSVVNVVRLIHVVDALDSSALAASSDPEVRYLEARRQVEEDAILLDFPVGHRGIVWLTPLERPLLGSREAGDACNLLGMRVHPDHDYVAVGIEEDIDLCRPSLGDGGKCKYFRPACNGNHWGLTLRLDTLKAQLREAVSGEGRWRVRIRCRFPPVAAGCVQPTSRIWSQYVSRESMALRNASPLAYADLVSAWAGTL